MRIVFQRLLVLVMLGSLCAPASSQENNQPPEGFVALFNGRDFDEWTGATTRDPRQVEALPPEERQQHEARMKRLLNEHWRVEDGVLVSDGQEPYLATTQKFGDFELWVDWLIGPKGDSGIYLRGVPQVQIWDPTDEEAHRNGADKGSGALWNNQKHERFPLEVADRPIGEWNRMFIRMVGPYVTVRLNDKLVVDNVVMENYYDRSIPVFMRGPIYLQTHGAETRFRNVFVRELPYKESNRALSQIRGGDDGFEPIFNGEDLTGWVGALDSYEVAGGSLRCKPAHGGNLVTENEYENFIARFEFKLPPGGNNGLVIRAPGAEGDLAYRAMELQVLDNSAEQYADLKDYQYHGSLYGLAPATRGFLRPVGEWNYQEVVVDGDRLEVHLNGFEILNANIAEARQKPLDGREHPGASRTGGHIGFAGHNDPVEFRNIHVKRLKSSQSPK